MSKNLFNTNTFQNKNVTNSNNIDTSITIDAATIDTAVIENIVNDELQGKQDALSTGDGIDITNNVISFDGTISQDITTGGTNSITAGTLNYIDSGVVTSVQTEIENKQDSLSTGDGIDITNNVISFDGTISQDITTGGTNSITAGTLNYIDNGVVTSVQTEIENKQDTLSAGDNISIVNNTISATDTNTTYTAATNGGLSLSGTEFSLDFDNTNSDIEIPQKLTIAKNGEPQLLIKPSSNYANDAQIEIRGSRNTTTSALQAKLLFSNYDADLSDKKNLGEICGMVNDANLNLGGLGFFYYPLSQTRTQGAYLSSAGNWTFGTGLQNTYKVQIDGNTQINGTLGITGFSNVRTAIEAKQDTISETNKLEPVLIDATQNGSAVSISRAEFGCLDGVTDNIQDQIDEKQDILSATNQLFPEYVKATASGSAVSISASEFGALDGVSSNIQTQINNKQPTLTAGDNISISAGNVISATDTDTTYTAGDNISISASNVISATDTDTTYTAGDNISISAGNVISATDTDTTYTAATNGGLSLSGTEFSLDFSTINSTVTIPQRLIIEEDTTAQILVKPASSLSNNAAIAIRGARNNSTSDRTCQLRFENYDDDLSDHNDLGEIAGLVQDPATNVGGLIFSNFADGSTRATCLTMNSNGRWHFGNSFQDSYKLQVTGASNFIGDISTTGDANVTGDINLDGLLICDNTPTTNTINRIVLHDGDNDYGFGISASTLNYYTNTTHRFQYGATIAGGGTVGMKLENANLTVNNNLTVANDATISNDLSVSNDVTITGHVEVTDGNILASGTDKVVGVDDPGVGFIKIKNKTTGGVIQFNNADDKLDIQHTVNNIMSIEPDKVRFYQNLIPDSSTLDIGSSSSRFQTGYFSSVNLSSRVESQTYRAIDTTQMLFQNSTGTTQMVLTNQGKLGIQTTTPGYDLTVMGDAGIGEGLTVVGDIEAQANINLSGLLVCDNSPVDDDINRILLYDGSTGDYGFGINSNTLTYHANQNHRFIYGSTTAGGGTIGMELSSSDLTVNGHVYRTPQMIFYNFGKTSVTNNTFGNGNYFNGTTSIRRLGDQPTTISSGTVTFSVNGTYRIRVGGNPVSDGYGDRMAFCLYLRIGSTDYFQDQNYNFHGYTYTRNSSDGAFGNISFEDYIYITSGTTLQVRHKLDIDNRNFDNTRTNAQMECYCNLQIERIAETNIF